MPNRRDFLLSVAASSAAFGILPGARNAFANSDRLKLTAGPMEYQLGGKDAPPSQLWVYNRSIPGPEIRVKKGQRFSALFENGLEEASSVHWHGIRIKNAMDGVSGLTQAAVETGGSFDYDFILPDAGTYWYHAHNRSWNQVARGLYGPLIVEEEEPAFDRDHDLTLMIDDWLVDENAVLHTDSLGSLMHWSHAGRLGNWLTVNGKSLPSFDLNAGEYYRLRLINASNARVLRIDVAAFGGKVIALDGQAREAPFEPDGPLAIAPAQRVDLLVARESGEAFPLLEVSGGEPFKFADFEVKGQNSITGKPPQLPLNDIPEPDLPNARMHRIRMSGGAMGELQGIRFNGKLLQGEDFRETGQVWALNGIANKTKEPMIALKSGETIIFEIINDTAFPHAMHTHGHHFRIIEGSNSNVPETAWRDTVLIERGQSAKIAFVADNPGKWLFHCHMLEHAAAGMTNWFEVA